MDKRGQFFILAAVIISSVIITLAATVNYARVTKQPDRFYHISSDLKYETSKIIDYGVYSNEDVNAKLGNFSSGVAGYLADSDPSVEFIFIYGNSTNITIENYAKNESTFNVGSYDVTLPGAGEPTSSEININFPGATISEPVSGTLGDYGRTKWTRYLTPAPDASLVTVTINGKNYNFNLQSNQQFVVIMKQQNKNETYVDIK